MVLALPQGYETPMGEAGESLSGGQRQRIALARALYGEPAVVLLDEPNASLDTDGEAALCRVLRQLKADGVTVIAVTHRPSLIELADRMLCLKDGQIEKFWHPQLDSGSAVADSQLDGVGGTPFIDVGELHARESSLQAARPQTAEILIGSNR